jgi:hypothetical protein
MGRRPPGFTCPLTARATAAGPSKPRCQASRTAGAESIQRPVTSGRPLNMTTAKGLPVPAIALIRSSWPPGNLRSLRELGSPVRDEGSPTASKTTSCTRAASTASAKSAGSSPKNPLPSLIVSDQSGHSSRMASASVPGGSAKDCTHAPRWSALSAYGPTSRTRRGDLPTGRTPPSFLRRTRLFSAAFRAASRVS